jgi:hypothetical protein
LGLKTAVAPAGKPQTKRPSRYATAISVNTLMDAVEGSGVGVRVAVGVTVGVEVDVAVAVAVAVGVLVDVGTGVRVGVGLGFEILRHLWRFLLYFLPLAHLTFFAFPDTVTLPA